MKRLIKRAMHAIFRRTEFLRRPVEARIEARFRVCVAESMDEVRVVLDDLVGEVYRLRNQVAALRDEIRVLDHEDAA